MDRELEKLNRLGELLRSGDAREIILKAGLSTAAVGEIVGVAQPNVWMYLNGQQTPRRKTALRLLWLLENLRAGQDG